MDPARAYRLQLRIWREADERARDARRRAAEALAEAAEHESIAARMHAELEALVRQLLA
ncbi:MAG: hypothetical protein LT106_18700 [Burkholderiaceae bacterium]|nr:hypothetical protein [Burkholderiaceae bacterium]